MGRYCWRCGSDDFCECGPDLKEHVAIAPIGDVVLPSEYFPKKQTDGAAGFDLVNNGPDVVLAPGQIVILPTGLAWQIPRKKIGLVCSRSGLATKGILVINAPGIIDSDYRGEVKVILGNVGPTPLEIKQYDRVAQMVIVGDASTAPQLAQLEWLTNTSRGKNGFGSTGT
jgi:dUTP pyrophosphatase